ncbi:MAG: riboflavin synthase [Verrucomicrobia bacterium]|nr:riboflavin synthase [Verrucomicrobiota bacterium]MBV9642231.1 riboflavin synthase [Verrucomicrobiota bacterium]
MFTGIIEAIGKVSRLVQSASGTYLLEIRTALASQMKIGASLANNGVCLTVISQTDSTLGFDLLAETVTRSNLIDLKAGDLVNLERSMAASSRFDGHIVQGHVDTTAKLFAIEAAGQDHRIEIELPHDFAQYVAYKGSIAVNGISLTVAELNSDRFVNWIIPHTWSQTNLHCLRQGARVNLEFDLFAKYVERLSGAFRAQNTPVHGAKEV